MPSARRKRLLARRSREEGLSSDDENSNVVLGNQNRTYASNEPEQNAIDENCPNLTIRWGTWLMVKTGLKN